jgi:hypothetical protein
LMSWTGERKKPPQTRNRLGHPSISVGIFA